MKIVSIIMGGIVLLGMAGGVLAADEHADKVDTLVQMISWDKQSSIKIDLGVKIIYLDPYMVQKPVKADLVLITHGHGDHFSPKDLKMVTGPDTKLVAPATIQKKVEGAGYTLTRAVAPGEHFDLEGIFVEVVAAYNPGKDYHPKSNRWVGYVLEIDGVKVYHPGDTGRIPEMKKITCDIAFMPLGQTYTMESVEQAAAAVLDVGASVAIPFHYGLAEGSKEDVKKFQALLKDKVRVVVK